MDRSSLSLCCSPLVSPLPPSPLPVHPTLRPLLIGDAAHKEDAAARYAPLVLRKRVINQIDNITDAKSF